MKAPNTLLALADRLEAATGNKPQLIKRCAKHKPELIDTLRGLYRCTSCGTHGRRSYGQRKFGRPPRFRWWTP